MATQKIKLENGEWAYIQNDLATNCVTEEEMQEYVDNAISSPRIYYYNSLALATDDIYKSSYTNAVDEEGAKIQVTIDGNIATISLLDSLEEPERVIVINSNVVLNTNSHNINLNGIQGILVINSDLTINGTDSSIHVISSPLFTIDARSTITINGGNYSLNATKATGILFNNTGCVEINNAECRIELDGDDTAYGIYNVGNTVTINDSAIYTSITRGNAYGIYNSTASTAIINNCTISADTVEDGTNKSSCGIHNYGKLEARTSTIISDACGDDVSEESGHGIINIGTATCIDTDCTATHCGFDNRNKAYINGGTFTGYSHGGFYLAHGADGEAFIKDATIRCGIYNGNHPEEIQASANVYGHMYMGGGAGESNSNMTAYLDGCTIGDPNVDVYNIIMRGSDGETNNTINISNSTFINKKVRLDNDTMVLNMGVGTNSEDIHIVTNFTTVGAINNTNEFYRRVGEIEIVNGNDYNALTELIAKVETGSSEIESNIYLADFKYENNNYAFNGSTFDDLENAYTNGKYIVARVTTDYIDYMPMTRRRITNNIIVYTFGNGTAYNPTSDCGDFTVAKLPNGNLMFTINNISANAKNIALADYYIDEVQHTRLDTALEALANRSGDKWEFIGEFNVGDEDVTEWIISEDAEGKPIELKQISIELTAQPATINAGNNTLLFGNPAVKRPFNTWCYYATRTCLNTAKAIAAVNAFLVLISESSAILSVTAPSLLNVAWQIGDNAAGGGIIKNCIGGVAMRAEKPDVSAIGAGSTIKIWGVRI